MQSVQHKVNYNVWFYDPNTLSIRNICLDANECIRRIRVEKEFGEVLQFTEEGLRKLGL